MELTEIGKRIKLCRKAKKLTQESLAEKINVSPHYIYEIERGLKTMSLTTLISLSQTFNVSTDFLLFGKNSDNSEQLDDLNLLLNSLSCDHRIAVTKILNIILPYLK